MDARTPHQESAATSATPPATDSTRESRRRFRALNLLTMLPVLAAVGVFLVAREAQTWQQAVVLGTSLVAALVAFERWSAGDLGRVAVPCVLLAAVAWPFGAFVVDGPLDAGYYPVVIAGSLLVYQVPRHRGVVAAALTTYVMGVGVVALLGEPQPDVEALIRYVILPTGLTVVMATLMVPNKRFYDVVADLEEARQREAELAVMRERVRFASDLHDIQGHTLHVVKLKIALAQKLLRHDTERVEQELAEMYTLVGDTIAQTKELAYGQRRLNLAAELENARHLFEAAGIHVVVDRKGEAGPHTAELLGQVLRETTTNILRHSRASIVQITLSERSIVIVNDGVDDSVNGPAADGARPPLRGLAVLAQRVADAGGELTVDVDGGRFRTAVSFPPAPGGKRDDDRARESARGEVSP